MLALRPGGGEQDFPIAAPETKPDLANRSEVARWIARNAPARLQQEGVGGAVSVLVLVGADGVVQNAALLARGPDPSYDEVALAALGVMRFHPARAGGCAVPFLNTLPITFGARRSM